MRPFFGYHMPNYTFPGDAGRAAVRSRRRAGPGGREGRFDMLTVMDHFYQIGVVGQEDEPMLEAYTTLGAIAMRTDEGAARDHGDRRHVSQPGAARQESSPRWT